jgi:hypothetical protein
MTGSFHRLVDGSVADWQTHAMLRGDKACPAGVSLCAWNSLSLFGSAADAAQIRRRVKRFRHHQIVRFAMEPSMGQLLRDRPTESSHHHWWPSPTVIPPPTGLEEAEPFG